MMDDSKDKKDNGEGQKANKQNGDTGKTPKRVLSHSTAAALTAKLLRAPTMAKGRGADLSIASSASVPDLTSAVGRRTRDALLREVQHNMSGDPGDDALGPISRLIPTITNTHIRYSRIYKKTSQDGNLVLFLPKRDLTIHDHGVDPLMGVALIHDSVIKNSGLKAYLQVILVFR